MTKVFSKSFPGCLSVLALVVWLGFTPAIARAEGETNSPARTNAASGDNESLRAFLQLQEQIRATQQSLERSRHETEATAARNAEVLQTRLTAIEKAMDNQSAKEIDNMQSANRLMLIAVGSFAAVGLVGMLLTAFLQWRAIHRLGEVTSLLPVAAHAGLPVATDARLLGSAATEQASARLFGALGQLEKRILELESTTHVIAPANGTTESQSNGSTHPEPEPQTDRTSVLLAKGESLLSLDKAEEALTCFNGILEFAPDHAEALVKKGVALEQLRKLEDALACYDRAILADSTLTMAYLQKGGLYNRLERYEEALKCYEQALRTQEKSHAA